MNAKVSNLNELSSILRQKEKADADVPAPDYHYTNVLTHIKQWVPCFGRYTFG